MIHLGDTLGNMCGQVLHGGCILCLDILEIVDYFSAEIVTQYIQQLIRSGGFLRVTLCLGHGDDSHGDAITVVPGATKSVVPVEDNLLDTSSILSNIENEQPATEVTGLTVLVVNCHRTKPRERSAHSIQGVPPVARWGLRT